MKKLAQLSVGVVAAASLMVTSCTTVDPYTREQKASNKIKGAAIGAAGGAALGALIGNNRSGGRSREGALIGALSGAVIGLGVGQYMDHQEALIRRELEGTGVSVSRVGNDLVLNMPSDITFSKGKSKLLSQFTSTLGSVATVFKKYKKTNISVIGHTDSDGGSSYNQNLSMARANSVAGYLSSRGLEGSRILTSGEGETKPVASNSSSAGKAQNRRVEIHVVPKSSQF